MRFTAILVSLGLICGCADSNPVRPTAMPPPPSSQTPPASDIVTPSISSISPPSAVAGSSDVTLKVFGTDFLPLSNHSGASWVIWTISGSAHDDGIVLRTTFISTTELTAVVPAAQLNHAVTAHMFVENGDIQGISDGYHGYPKSNAVDFNVAAR